MGIKLSDCVKIDIFKGDRKCVDSNVNVLHKQMNLNINMY